MSAFAVSRTESISQKGAYADVTVKVGLIKLLKKQFDVCEEAYVLIVTMIVLISLLSQSYCECEHTMPGRHG